MSETKTESNVINQEPPQNIVIDIIQIKKVEKRAATKFEQYELKPIRFGEPLIVMNPNGTIDKIQVQTYQHPYDLMSSEVDVRSFQEAERILKAASGDFAQMWD